MNAENFYTKLRKRIKNWENTEKGQKHKYVEYFLAIPDIFYVVFKLEFDPRIPIETKLKLGGVLFYWFMPIDIIPEAIFGLFGYLDDLALSVLVLSGLMNSHGDSQQLIQSHDQSLIHQKHIQVKFHFVSQ